MADRIFDEDNTNLSTSTESVESDLGAKDANYLWLINNTTGQTVDVEFFGTHDDDSANNDSVSLGTTSVSASSSAFETLTVDAWELVHIEVTPQVDPTSGSVTIDEMGNR